MPVPSRQPGEPANADGGRTRVDLDELIGLRLRVPRAPRLHPVVARASRAGSHVARLRGRGMDYRESRAYQAGDDVRHLDWRLTARSGKLHTKLFQEERERSLWLLVDCNPGMYFGTRQRFKSVQAARAAALAAWFAAAAGERVGLLGFGGCRDFQRALAGQRGALAVCGALARWDRRANQHPPEPLGDALARMQPLLRGTSRILLVSDGQTCGDAVAARLLALRRQAQLGVLVVADALELAPPPPGRYPFEHDGRRRLVDLVDPAARRAFQQAAGAGPARLLHRCQALALPCRQIDTRSDPLQAVRALLGQRPGSAR